MTEENDVQAVELDEREVLKKRATQMGIKFKDNIPTNKLKDLIAKKLSGDSEEAAPVKVKSNMSSEAQDRAKFRRDMKRKASALKRITVTCMNPAKRDHEGEIFTVSNKVIGSFKRYVPYNTPWHVESVILDMIKDRKCQIFTTVRNKDGSKTRKGKLISEFSIDLMEPLTKEELKDLATQQAMANNLDD